MLASRFVVNSVADVAVSVVRIFVVVQVGGQAHVDSAQRVDHVAKSDEVDGDVPVEGEPGHLAHLVLGGMPTAVAPGEFRGDAADDVRVRHLVGGVDLVGPDPAGRRLKVHAYYKVSGDGKETHSIGRGVDGGGHDRIGEVRCVVLLAAHAEHQDVDLLAVLELVSDGALLR